MMDLEALFASGQAIQASVVDRHPWIEELLIVGIGWATVELDRTERELVGLGCVAWERAPRDDLLGASVRLCRDPGLQCVLLEPDTEGRLAASLARFGEGVAAVYLRWIDERGGSADARRALGPPGSGPMGSVRMLLGLPRWGPHVIVVEPGLAA